MISNFLYSFPFLLFYLPLIASVIICIIQNKHLSLVVTISTMVLLFFGFLAIILDFDFTNNLYVNIQNNTSLLGGEFKINTLNIYFVILLIFIHLLVFLNSNYEIIGKTTKHISHRKYFFATYLLNIFAIIGIFLTTNICNYFLFLEIYSFTLYTLTSDYKDKNMAILSFKSFSNGILGSIIILLSIFALVLYFNTTNILYIYQKLMSINIYHNLQLFIIFITYTIGIFIKFFASSFHIAINNNNTENVIKTNFLSFLMLFINMIIGIYCLLFFNNSLFNLSNIFGVPFIRAIFIILNIGVIFTCIYFLHKNLTIINIVNKSMFINLALILIFMAVNNRYSTYLSFLFIIDHLLITFAMYLITNILYQKYQSSDLSLLSNEPGLKYIFIFLCLLKIGLPLSIIFFTNGAFILFILLEKMYLLFIPFLVVKLLYIYIMSKVLLCESSNETENLIDEFSTRRINIFSVTLLVLVVLIILTIFCNGQLKNLIY